MHVADLCTALVQIPTMAPQPTEQAIDVCADALAPTGFRVIYRGECPAGITHALLEREGEDPPLLIDGHLDTVPVGDESRWQVNPLGGDIVDGNLWGRGAADTKGPLAAAIMALRATSSPRRLLLSLGGDEETDMEGIRLLAEHPAVREATQAIVLEPTELTAVAAHKGVSRIRIDVTGRSAHASRPWDGRNAIEEKIRLISAITAWFAGSEEQRRVAFFGDEPSTLVLTREFTLNTAFNVVPDRTSFWYNYRPLPGNATPFAEFIAAVGECAHALGIDAHVEVEFSAPSLLCPENSPLVRTLVDASGRAPGWVSYGTHAGILSAGREAVVFGPGSIAVAHRENECIALQDLDDGVRVLTATFDALS